VVNNRRALELLAASPDGATEAILVAHGLTIDLLVESGPRRARDGDHRARGRSRTHDRGRAGEDHRGRAAHIVEVSPGRK
jgi:hypothetical protein